MENAPTTLNDARRIFNEAQGREYPLRTEDELREAIHANGLQWGRNDEMWDKFWNMLFESKQGQEWLYSETPPDFNPLMDAIYIWIAKNDYELSEDRNYAAEMGYTGPDDSFLVVNAGQGENPFWNFYLPPGDGEQPDESGEWDRVPHHDPR